MCSRDAVVDLVAIGHQDRAFADSGIKLLGVGSATAWGIAEQAHRRPAAVHLRPQITLALRRPTGFLEHLNDRLVTEHQFGIEQVIAQQIDDRLHCFADPDHAAGQRIAGEVAAETANQCGLPVKGQRILIFGSGHPGQSSFGQQSLGNDPGWRRGDLDPLVAARTGVFDALVLNDANLLWNDVQLFADFDADFHQRLSVMGTNPFGCRQFMTNDLAGQCRIKGLATPLLAGMPGNLDAGVDGDFLGHRPIDRSQRFRFVEEVCLSIAARLALGGKEFAHEGPEFLLQEITLDLDDFEFAAQGFAFGDGRLALGNQRVEFLGGQGHGLHMTIGLNWPKIVHPTRR